MSPGNVDDVNSPRSMKNIVLEVMDYVEARNLQINSQHPADFETYDAALKAIWPELYKACSEAALLVAISIYVEIAERWDFHVEPSMLKELKL